MSVIKRYHYYRNLDPPMREYPTGDYILYSDHLQAIQERDARNAADLAELVKHADTIKGLCKVIEELKAQLKSMHALDPDGDWPSYGQLAQMFVGEQETREAAERRIKELDEELRRAEQAIFDNIDVVMDAMKKALAGRGK